VNALTHHMVDDEKMEAIEAFQVFKQPMRGGRQALEDAALGVYLETCVKDGPEAGKRAWIEFWKQNQQR
jgi:hypothetical protein